MAIQGVDTKCYILALFIRDDDERFLLGSGQFEFKDSQKQFEANAIQNDVVEVQGNDGYLLAGQVRRSGTQNFDGYVGDGTMAKTEVEENRRKFFAFYQKNHFYRVVYVFPDGTAIQRKRGFLVDDPTVQELYQQYPEYHVALNFEDVNYYTYSENEQGEEIYAEEAIIDLSVLRATGGLIWDEYGAVSDGFTWGGETTVTGTEFQIQNELDLPAPVSDAKIYGDTEQQTYSGKNLFNKNALSNGWIDSNGNANTDSSWKHTDYISIQPSTTYTTSGFVNGSGVNPGRCYYDSNKVFISGAKHNNAEPFTNTSPSNAHYMIECCKSGDINTLQIEQGFATAYEPYVGGIASPNPEYPQDIHVVTDEQMVGITGKNKINPSNLSYAYATNISRITLASLDTGIKVTVSSGTDVQPIVLFRSIDLTNYVGSTIRMNGTFDAVGSEIRIGRMDASGGNRTGTVIGATSGEPISFTVPSDLGSSPYLFYGVRCASTSTQLVNNFTNLILTVDDGVIPFEPYQSQSYTVDLGSTELCKLGDYQDYIYKNGTDWYIHKEVGRIKFTGTESGWVSNSGVFVITLGGIFPPGNTTPPVSNYFTGQTSDNYSQVLDKHLSLHSTSTPNSQRIVIKYSDLGGSVDALKTWLSTHNTTVYYPRTTSVDTQITDTDLIDALNALGKIKLFVGENNVLVSASGTNLPGELSLTYYTTLDTTGSGYVWEEGGSGGPTMVEINSITNVYPIWKIFGPAVNPELSILTTNTTLTYNGTVASGQYLVIDMMNKTAKLNGTSVIGNISGDWVNLRPGVNRVVYATDNSDTPSSIIEWQEVVG